MKNHNCAISALTIGLLGISLMSPPAHSAAFYIQEQSVSGLGTAFAGSVADTPDASTIYYNPAGMTDLGRAQMSLGTHILIPSADFKNAGSTAATTVGTGGATAALSGTNDDPFSPAAIPNAYLAFPLTARKDWWAGLGISAPFGLSNEYNDDFFGRYDSTENELVTINVAPSLAWAPYNWLSVGFGVDVQYADAKLESAVPSTITAGGPDPSTDGYTDLSGNDTTVGFNGGIIFKPQKATRIGLHYRQGISHTLEGRLITQVPLDIPGVGGTFTNVGGQAELDLPDISTLAVAHHVNDRLQLLGHISFTEWSNFDDIPILLADGTFTQDEQNYDDTWSVAVGARYQLNDSWQLKIGAQYDQTPTQNGFRTTRIPDGDRTWIAAGASYDINANWTLDFSAAYVDVSEEDVDLTSTTTIGATTATVNTLGTTEGDVGIISAALRYKFDSPF